MEDVKIYGLCLERLKHQIHKARNRVADTALYQERLLLECYNTGEVEDIIDILELYDVEDRTFEQVDEKLNELAYTVSVLTSERLTFGYTQNGQLGLYLSLDDLFDRPMSEEEARRAAVAL